MNVPIVAFFNNKGGVGKTSLVYHLTWMYANLGVRVIAADLDPQANLTAAFLSERRLETLWLDNNYAQTIYGSISPLIEGTGDIAKPHTEQIEEGLYQLSLLGEPLLFSTGSLIALLAGDLALSQFEDQLSDVWPRCLDGDPRAFRVISAFWRIMQNAAENHGAKVILLDLGPNLGAINRAALIAADYVVTPLSPDLFSLQGLRNLGPTLNRWRQEWDDRLTRWQAMPKSLSSENLRLPAGTMKPAGYVVLQHAVRMDRPIKAYDHWIAEIPHEYRRSVLGENLNYNIIPVTDDEHCLALLKHYRSLMPLAQEAHKPMFYLKPADGAIGSHMQAVQGADKDFRQLAINIAQSVNLSLTEAQ
jgi:chromosome partitioning protein